ncbi:hypothetical protein AUN00_22380 [Cronobacter sakazakii]|nr:hypothetical protein B7T06_22300 [Cronobacter sakazakii]PUW09683.1 hypothetical protein AUN00_22380 [Cronobacter sakazakii]
MSGSKNYSVERKKKQAQLTAKLGLFIILPIFCIYLLEHKTNIFPSFIFSWIYIAGLIIYLIGAFLIHLKISESN